MRRAAALLLSAWLGALLLLPVLLAAGQARLPACCRAAGKHHCGLRHAAAPNTGPSLHADPSTCPFRHADAALPAAATPVVLAAPAYRIALACQATLAANPIAPYRPAFARSWSGRGPPAFFA